MIVKYTVATRGLHVIPCTYIAASVRATVKTCYYNIYFFLVGNMIFLGQTDPRGNRLQWPNTPTASIMFSNYRRKDKD